MSNYLTIKIHPAAPEKPVTGAPCNGCGVCCIAAPCPVSALFLAHRENACPALVWYDAPGLYRCGMLLSPHRYLRWLPSLFTRPFIFLVRRWLALEIGCDCYIEAH